MGNIQTHKSDSIQGFAQNKKLSHQDVYGQISMFRNNKLVIFLASLCLKGWNNIWKSRSEPSSEQNLSPSTSKTMVATLIALLYRATYSVKTYSLLDSCNTGYVCVSCPFVSEYTDSSRTIVTDDRRYFFCEPYKNALVF